MLFVHIVERDLPDDVADRAPTCWSSGRSARPARSARARGLDVQQIDTGAFADDERQHRWLAAAGFERVRTWWQMNRPVAPARPTWWTRPTSWEKDGVVFRLVRRSRRRDAGRDRPA